MSYNAKVGGTYGLKKKSSGVKLDLTGISISRGHLCNLFQGSSLANYCSGKSMHA